MRNAIKIGLLGPSFAPAEEVIETVKRIESLGWDFVDFPDQMVATHPTGMLRPPVPAGDPTLPTGIFSDVFYGSMEMCTMAAAVTRDVGIILGVIDPLRRSPAVMAQEMATLSHLSKGRVTFAIGAGEAKQFEPYGESRVKPFARMEEAIHVWRTLWQSGGKPISRDSEFWPLKDACFPLPLYDNRLPSLLMVGGGARVIQLAGTVADGWLTYLPAAMDNDLEALTAIIRQIKEIASAHGRDPEALRFNAMINIALADDDKKAWELARHPVCGWIAIAALGIDSSAAWEKLGHQHPFGNFVWSKDMRVTLVSADKVPELTKAIPDEITDAAIVWGNPERVAKRLRRYVDAGFNELCLMNLGASCDPEYSATWNKNISDVMVRLGHQPLALQHEAG